MLFNGQILCIGLLKSLYLLTYECMHWAASNTQTYQLYMVSRDPGGGGMQRAEESFWALVSPWWLSVKMEVERTKDMFICGCHILLAQSRCPFLCRVSGPSDDPMNRTYQPHTMIKLASQWRILVSKWNAQRRFNRVKRPRIRIGRAFKQSFPPLYSTTLVLAVGWMPSIPTYLTPDTHL